jgi:hypothetical protein
MHLRGREREWRLVSTAAGLVCAMVAKRLLRAVYEAVRHDPEAPSPFDINDARFSWPNALVWAAAAGVGLGAAKVVSARIAVIGWEAATRTSPPGVADDRG